MQTLSFTWLGHGTFTFRTPGGKRLLIDPWVQGNPACPPAAKQVGPLDLILITHGHGDHTEDAISLARSTGARVVANHEISVWLQEKGIQNATGMNHGGTVDALGLSITMVPAMHSSSVEDDGRTRYMGLAAGFVIRFENDLTIYFSGDTGLFGDMRLIGELYRPSVAFLSIGDHYTMGPRQAAKAVELVGVKRVVPMHFGTFPILTGTPAELRKLLGAQGVEVFDLKPGDSAEL